MSDPSTYPDLDDQLAAAADRFWAKVDTTDGCWLWTGATTGKSGYGQFRFQGRMQVAHRVAFLMVGGSVPDGLELDHLCRVRLCVHPDHLEPVTRRENTLRGESFAAVNAQKTHCLRGHELTPDNTYVWRGGRSCRACRPIREGRSS